MICSRIAVKTLSGSKDRLSSFDIAMAPPSTPAPREPGLRTGSDPRLGTPRPPHERVDRPIV
ncbi:hypothetical protein GCM10010472_24640 [Pseudonocardia halophobica]|uniref:Uncharacterized protein n=1 Tax=Pseudonocardia halophobica TaxID=29401 RepID=A0A9W6L007_9PSEU|nr:hypothetical protein GCM10017577_08360 [Pseudonocardia halophobica]